MSHEIKWQAEDGYCGGARPHYVSIDESDIEDDATDDDLLSILEEVVNADFEDKVAPSWSDKEQDKFLAWAHEVQASRRSDT